MVEDQHKRVIMMRLLVLFLSLLHFAYASAGSVVRVEGDAFIIRDGAKMTAVKEAELLPHDVITTEKGGRAQIQLSDDTLITVGENGVFALDAYVFDGSDSKADFSFVKGSIKFLTGQIGKHAPQKFKIHAKTATIGIRGTYVGAFVKDDTLGVLYLGHGRGATVSNDKGMTLLDEIGDGVFVSPSQTPPRKAKWSKAQVAELLNEVDFKEPDLLPPADLSYLENWKWGGAVRWFYAPKENEFLYGQDLIGSFTLTTASWHDIYAETSFDIKKPIGDNSDGNDKTLSTFSRLSVHYETGTLHIKAGRDELETPMSAVTPVGVSFNTRSFGQWDEKAKIYDWWWALPTTYEALTADYLPNPYLKLTASRVEKIKQAQSNEFVSLSENYLGEAWQNSSKTTGLNLVGVQALLFDTTKAQAWHYNLTDVMDIDYVELKSSFSIGEVQALVGVQYAQERSSSDLNQSIDAYLSGLQVAARYQGLTLGASFSQTGDEPFLTPFDGMPAFTNTFVLHSNLSAQEDSLYEVTGPYTADTTAQKLSAGVDLNYFGIDGINILANVTHLDKKDEDDLMKVWSCELSYLPPKHENLFFDIKYATVDNMGYADKNAEFTRFMAGMKF